MLVNTSRFVLWFCVSDVSNIIICEKLRDENFWFWLVFVNCLSDGGAVVVATIKFAVMCVVVVCVIFFVRCDADEHINIR